MRTGFPLKQAVFIQIPEYSGISSVGDMKYPLAIPDSEIFLARLACCLAMYGHFRISEGYSMAEDLDRLNWDCSTWLIGTS
jgi:hypothetical protein